LKTIFNKLSLQLIFNFAAVDSLPISLWWSSDRFSNWSGTLYTGSDEKYSRRSIQMWTYIWFIKQ